MVLGNWRFYDVKSRDFPVFFQGMANPAKLREFDSEIQTTRDDEEALMGELSNRIIDSFEWVNRSEQVNTEEAASTAVRHWEGYWSSYKGLTVDTLAHRGDEGRGYLR